MTHFDLSLRGAQIREQLIEFEKDQISNVNEGCCWQPGTNKIFSV